MAEGTIKRLTDRGFGFIETSPGNDIFSKTYVRDSGFHSTRVKVPKGHAPKTSALSKKQQPPSLDWPTLVNDLNPKLVRDRSGRRLLDDDLAGSAASAAKLAVVFAGVTRFVELRLTDAVAAM